MQDILTEKEAKTRWCPMARAITVRDSTKDSREYVVANRAEGDFPFCIASDCMAWRLAHKDAADGTERGYCGAFGEPKFT